MVAPSHRWPAQHRTNMAEASDSLLLCDLSLSLRRRAVPLAISRPPSSALTGHGLPSWARFPAQSVSTGCIVLVPVLPDWALIRSESGNAAHRNQQLQSNSQYKAVKVRR